MDGEKSHFREVSGATRLPARLAETVLRAHSTVAPKISATAGRWRDPVRISTAVASGWFSPI